MFTNCVLFLLFLLTIRVSRFILFMRFADCEPPRSLRATATPGGNGKPHKAIYRKEHMRTMTSQNERTTPSAAAEGKANGDRDRAQEAARKTAEIRQRQRSMMNAMLCCMI